MSDQYFTLPEHLADFVQAQVAEGGYAGVGEYVVQLVESERRRKAMARLEAELLERVESDVRVKVDDEDWKSIRQKLDDRLKSRNAS